MREEANAGFMGKNPTSTQITTSGANTGFLCGTGGLIIALILACLLPNPTHFQVGVFAAFTALGGAGFCTGLSGVFEVKTKIIKAAGPMAVFLLIFWGITHLAAPELMGGIEALWGK